MARLLALLLVLPHAAFAQADLRVSEAIRHYDGGEFLQAKDILVTVVDSPRLSKTQRTRARIYLAASYYAVGDVPSAKAQLLTLARTDPKAQVDPALFVPELVALWQDAREEVGAEQAAADRERAAAEAERAAQAEREAKAAAAKAKPADPPAALTPRTWAGPAAFIPFGGGQFARGDRTMGYVFLGAGVAAYGTGAAVLALFESKKVDGKLFEYGYFENPDEARLLQNVYVTAFWVGHAVLVAGVVEALIAGPAPAQAGLKLGARGLEVRF